MSDSEDWITKSSWRVLLWHLPLCVAFGAAASYSYALLREVGAEAGLLVIVAGVCAAVASLGAGVRALVALGTLALIGGAKSTEKPSAPNKCRRTNLFKNTYAYCAGEDEVELEVWSGLLEPERLGALGIALLGGAIHAVQRAGLNEAVEAGDVPLVLGLILLLSTGLAIGGVLRALQLSSRHQVRLEAQGPLRLTTHRLLGPTVRRELPRSTPLEFRHTPAPRWSWQLVIAEPGGDTEVYLEGGPGLPPEETVKEFETLAAAFSRLAGLA